MLIPVLAVVIVVAVWWLTRMSELFYISVRDGKTLVVRGRVPVSMLQEFKEAVATPRVKRGSIRAFRTESGGQLVCTGDIGDGREQRMRNTFMLYPASPGSPGCSTARTTAETGHRPVRQNAAIPRSAARSFLAQRGVGRGFKGRGLPTAS